jgi:ferredoxin
MKGAEKMKAIVDKSGCISCGLCVSVCPEVFRLDDSGVAEAYEEVSDKLQDSATEARDGCPVSVISLED